MKNRKSFTLMELMIVAVLVAVLAVMALTAYKKTVNQAYVDEAIRQLTLIHGAEQVYKAKNGTYWPPSDIPVFYLPGINQNLGLNLTDSPFTFACTGDAGGTSWICMAQYRQPPNEIVVVVNQNPIDSNNPHCAINCP